MYWNTGSTEGNVACADGDAGETRPDDGRCPGAAHGPATVVPGECQPVRRTCHRGPVWCRILMRVVSLFGRRVLFPLPSCEDAGRGSVRRLRASGGDVPSLPWVRWQPLTAITAKVCWIPTGGVSQASRREVGRQSSFRVDVHTVAGSAHLTSRGQTLAHPSGCGQGFSVPGRQEVPLMFNDLVDLFERDRHPRRSPGRIRRLLRHLGEREDRRSSPSSRCDHEDEWDSDPARRRHPRRRRGELLDWED
jgi:hypothetical protein